MNEEELQLMVARARDAEGSPSQPPPGLVDEARTAARRRRWVVTLGAGGLLAAVIVAGVAVPRLIDETDVDHPAPAVNTGELAEHGGPCPSVLPTPTDDGGHGFGTSTPADQAPRFATPDSAWVCQYGTRSIGATDEGTQWEWALHQTPRRLDDARLGPVDASLQDIATTGPQPQICTEELGPRWLLVTATDGDLTGVLVDGYGCQDVRLTDDPFVTAPGDPQVGSTVPGVLTAPGLASILEDWWNTSPADVEGSATPDELRVTCTDDGPQVESTTVAATPAGVVLVVDSTMSKRRSYLAYTSEGLSGGDDLSLIPSPATYQFPPGALTIGCASPPGMDEIAPVDIEVVDPNGYWRTSTLDDLGCTSSAITDWIAVGGEGSTAALAVDALLDDFAAELDRPRADYDAEPAPTGYSGAPTQTWVAYLRGTPDFSVDVTLSGSSYSARPNLRCDRQD